MKYITPDKIMYHPEVLAEWYKGKTPSPVNFELHLSDRCCNKCYYCSAWEAKKDGKQMIYEDAYKCINFIRHVGAKAVTFSGGGEPLMHYDAIRLINHASDCGLDIGIITNGVMLNKEKAIELLNIKNVRWIRFSFDAVNAKQYKQIRGTNHFDIVKKNIKFLLKERKRLKKEDITIGIQNVVNKFNYSYIKEFVEMCDVEFSKLDYIQIRPIEVKLGDKPYTLIQLERTEAELFFVKEMLNKKVMISDKWDLIFDKREFGFSKCWCSSIIPTINSECDVWVCCHTNRTKGYFIGNACDMSPADFFKNINKTISELPNLGLDPRVCPTGCRGSNVNRMMEGIKRGHPHQNFL